MAGEAAIPAITAAKARIIAILIAERLRVGKFVVARANLKHGFSGFHPHEFDSRRFCGRASALGDGVRCSQDMHPRRGVARFRDVEGVLFSVQAPFGFDWAMDFICNSCVFRTGSDR